MGWVNPSRARRLIPCSVNDYMEARSTQLFKSLKKKTSKQLKYSSLKKQEHRTPINNQNFIKLVYQDDEFKTHCNAIESKVH